MKVYFYIKFYIVALSGMSVECKFGVGGNNNRDTVDTEVNGVGELQLDLQDPEYLQAMELFANMNPDEMAETMEEVKEMLGNDPETLAAIEEVKKQIPTYRSIKHSLEDLISKDEVKAATQDALKLLSKMDDMSWGTIWNRQSDILEAVIKSGQMSKEDAILYRTQPDAWEKELRFIWDELQKQAAEVV